MVSSLCTMSPVSCSASARTMGSSDHGRRNSDEEIFEALDHGARCAFTWCSASSPVGSLSRLGRSKDMGRGLRGDMGCVGLKGGRVIGVRGMWKYFVDLGRSTVAIAATVLVRVGGWYVMPKALCNPVT